MPRSNNSRKQKSKRSLLVGALPGAIITVTISILFFDHGDTFWGIVIAFAIGLFGGILLDWSMSAIVQKASDKGTDNVDPGADPRGTPNP